MAWNCIIRQATKSATSPTPAPSALLHVCLKLEDSDSGVRAAHAAGVPVIMVPDLLPATDEMRALALAAAADLDQVRGWLVAAKRP